MYDKVYVKYSLFEFVSA